MIVIPMAGLSQRFTRAGYDRPKYMLDLQGRPVFDYAVASFARLFETEDFAFVMRDVEGTAEFVRQRLAALGVANAKLVALDEPTAGQAETVAVGLDRAGCAADAPVTIFNIDSFRPGFFMTQEERAADGYLEVFDGEGEGWSFVKPVEEDRDKPEGLAARVVEKQRISDLCCTGLYHFASAASFLDAYARERETPSQELAEHYVAPIFNQLVLAGGTVRYRTIPTTDVVFCGVPAEYEALKADPSPIDGMLERAGV